jgi:hypothetical protein
VDQWLTQARDPVARTSGAPADQLEFDGDGALLELARVAAHESGERTNAPLLRHLFGRARRGDSLDRIAGAVRRSTS